MRNRAVALLLLAALAAQPAAAARVSAAADERAIRDFTSGFLRAFENLDMPAFIDCFAADATVFFPVPEPPERFAGKPAIQAHFQQVFAAIRKSSGRSQPPYHRLDPEDLLIQRLSRETAIVSFHLRNSERLARRTLVLVKLHGRWRIAHLHASNVPTAR